MTATKTQTSNVKVIVFDHLDEDMPLFLELFAPHAREHLSIESLYDSIENPSFFQEKGTVYVRCDVVPKKMRWDLLFLSEVPIFLFFSKVLKDAQGVDCRNFSMEKPWERQKRVFQWVDHFCQKQKKSLQKEAFDRLFRIHEGYGLSILRSVEQILLTLTTPLIHLEILEKHHFVEVGPSDWEKARQMVFAPKHILRPDPLDMLGFISKIRQEVYFSLFAFETEPKVSIPPFRKKEMKDLEQMRQRLGIEYFYALLPLLLEVEMLAKSGSFTQEMLFDLLFTRTTALYSERI